MVESSHHRNQARYLVYTSAIRDTLLLPKWYRLCGSEDLEALSIVTVQIILAETLWAIHLTNLLRFATLIDIPFCGDRELLFAPPYLLLPAVE